MKKFIPPLLILLTLTSSSQDWTWMRGSNTGSIVATYGTMGVAAPTNDPGGRHGAACWTDANGNLWQFGGEGYASTPTFGWLNDLWKYNPATNQWTWVRGSNTVDQFGNYGTIGVAAPTNEPGAREFPMWWKDNNGNFWLFGGEGFDAVGSWGSLNDLWKYDPITNQWTWMKGDNTINQFGVYGPLAVPVPFGKPGSRRGGAAWTDSNNNLWLFGGNGYSAAGPPGYLDDLWKYDITTGDWAHMLGSTTTNQVGVYGPKGVALPSNAPGGREFPAMSKDLNGNFWMFGGSGYPSTSTSGYLNDLWQFNPTSGMWTYASGTMLSNQFGNHGTITVASATNNPGGRNSAYAITDNAGDIWLFGGFGYPGTTGVGRLNDLWKYQISTDEWTWMKGFNGINQNGIYGTMGVSAPANNPGGRYYNIGWADANGDMWIFGSYGHPSTSVFENMNDLWKYKIVTCAPTSVTNPTALTICNGNSTSLSVSATGTVNWYNSLTSTVSIGTGSTLTTPTLSAGTYTFYAEALPCAIRTPITVSVTVCSSLNSLENELFNLSLYPNPNNGTFIIKTNLKDATFVLYNALGQEILKKEINNENYFEVNTAKGIYHYSIFEKGLKIKTEKIVIE